MLLSPPTVSVGLIVTAFVFVLAGTVCDGSKCLCILTPTGYFGVAHFLLILAMWVVMTGGAAAKPVAKPATEPHDYYARAPDAPADAKRAQARCGATVYAAGYRGGGATPPFVLPPRSVPRAASTVATRGISPSATLSTPPSFNPFGAGSGPADLRGVAIDSPRASFDG